MHKDFGEEANSIINDLHKTLEAKCGELEGLWAEIKAKDEQFRLCAVHGGNTVDAAPQYCPKCWEEQISGLQSDYRNVCQQNIKQLATLCRYKTALEQIASILPFSPADGFHCKQTAMKALEPV